VFSERWKILITLFFGRFFDRESISPQSEAPANVVQTLGLLAVPGAFFVILFQPFGLQQWDLVAVRFFVVSMSLNLMGLIAAFAWDSLFLDRRDYQILTPLPLGCTTLLLTKTLALVLFLGIFLADMNLFLTLFWPGIDGRRGMANLLLAHCASVIGAGLFAALAVASIKGVLITCLGGKALRSVSVWIQTILIGTFVMLIFVCPFMISDIGQLVTKHSPIVYWYPGFWFTGLYEWMRPAADSQDLRNLGALAVKAFCCIAVLFPLALLPGYRSHARKVLETPESNPSGPGRLARRLNLALNYALLRSPLQRAVFHFIGQTITRSMKHRVFLASYAGFGAALAITELASPGSGLLELPLTLSFVLISGLRAAFNFPSELRANWSFQISETDDTGEYLMATRKWIVLLGVLPLFALLAPVEFIRFPWNVAVFHLAFGVTLSALLAEVMFAGFRKVPFTCAHFPGKFNLAGLSAVYLLGFTMYSQKMAALELWLSARPGPAAAFFIAAAGLYVALLQFSPRMLTLEPGLDYEDEGDPAVRTILTPQ
jgi:hypothetical protein